MRFMFIRLGVMLCLLFAVVSEAKLAFNALIFISSVVLVFLRDSLNRV